MAISTEHNGTIPLPQPREEYEKGRMTRRQFLKGLAVGLGAAGVAAGGGVVVKGAQTLTGLGSIENRQKVDSISVSLRPEDDWNQKEITELSEGFDRAAKTLQNYFGPPEGKTIKLIPAEHDPQQYKKGGEWYSYDRETFYVYRGYKGVPPLWVSASMLAFSWGYPDMDIAGFRDSRGRVIGDGEAVNFPPGQFFGMSGIEKFEGIMAKLVEEEWSDKPIKGNSIAGKIISIDPSFFVKLKNTYSTYEEGATNETSNIIPYGVWLGWVEKISPDVYKYWSSVTSVPSPKKP